MCKASRTKRLFEPSYLGIKAYRNKKKNIFNMKGNTLRSQHYNSEKKLLWP